MNKKLLSALLAAITIFTMSACGQSTSTEPKATASESVTTIAETEKADTDGLPETNMNGFKFNILHHDESWLTWAVTKISADEENGDLINDAMYNRNLYIDERFNCEVNVKQIPVVSDIFKQTVMSGDNEYDIIMQYGINVLPNIEYIMSFTNIPYLNLSAEYWNPDATDIFKIGDKQLAVAGNFTLSYLSGSACFLFNKELYENLNINNDIYGLVYNGKWTVDKFFETAKYGEADLNGDGTMDKDDRYGVTGSIKAFYNTLITGAGIKYVQMDENSYPYFDVANNEKTISFMQKLLDAVTSDSNLFYNDASDVNTISTLDFASGDTLFQQTQVTGIGKYRDMEIDFGIVPAPKYDEQQDKYYSYTNIGEIATLPISFELSRAEYVGILLEAMSYYSDKNIVPIYREVVLQTKYTRDDASPDMLQYVFDGISFDYGIVVWQEKIGNVFMINVFKPKSSTIVSTIATINDSLITAIDELKTAAENMP